MEECSHSHLPEALGFGCCFIVVSETAVIMYSRLALNSRDPLLSASQVLSMIKGVCHRTWLYLKLIRMDFGTLCIRGLYCLSLSSVQPLLDTADR